MSNKRNVLFIFLFGGAIVLTLGFAVIYVGLMLWLDSDLTLGDSVAVVEIQGEMFYDLNKVQEIEDYRDDDDVKAVLLNINTPGGGVVASQALFHAVRSTAARKPVVAFMGPVAASGGYYVACAADSILAYEGTMTGSIGVIASYLNTQGLLEKVGLGVTIIKSGRLKDVGSPYRPMSDEERAYLEVLMDGVYTQFLRAVSEGRGMSIEQVEDLAEGRIYTGEDAAAVGLVDRVASFEDAVMVAARMGGIEGYPELLRRREHRSLAERFLGTAIPRLPVASSERVRLQYIIP